MIERTDDKTYTLEELQARAEFAEDTEAALADNWQDTLVVIEDDDPALLDSHGAMQREYMRLWRTGDFAGARAAMDKWYMDTFGY